MILFGRLWVDRYTWGNCQLEKLRAEAYLDGGDGCADVEKRVMMNVRCDEVDEGCSRLRLFLVMEGCLQIKSDRKDR